MNKCLLMPGKLPTSNISHLSLWLMPCFLSGSFFAFGEIVRIKYKLNIIIEIFSLFMQIHLCIKMFPLYQDLSYLMYWLIGSHSPNSQGYYVDWHIFSGIYIFFTFVSKHPPLFFRKINKYFLSCREKWWCFSFYVSMILEKGPRAAVNL